MYLRTYICIRFITINIIHKFNNIAATHIACVCLLLSNNNANYIFVEKLPSARRTFDLPRQFSLLHIPLREKASLKRCLTHARSSSLPFCTCDVECVHIRKPEKYSRPRCRFTYVSRGWWRRRFKARRACLANISKTKYKLTRRPFVVYITPRSRGVEKAAARKVRLSLGAITFMHFFIVRSLRIIAQCFYCTRYLSKRENIRSK